MSDDFLGKSKMDSVRKHFQLYVLINSFCLVHLLIFTETYYLSVHVLRVMQDTPYLVLFQMAKCLRGTEGATQVKNTILFQ